MASVESMDRRVRPHRYARRRLDFQLAAYRLLVFDICFSFVNLIEAPERNAPRRTYVIFSRNGNQGSLFPYIQECRRFFRERARNILIDVK